MPRGSVPWPRRNGGAVVRTDAAVAATSRTDDRQTAAADVDERTSRGHAVAVDGITAAAAAVTVHLVDTCGRIVDVRPVVDPSPERTSAAAAAAAVASPLLLQSLPLRSDEVDRVGGCEQDRPKNAAAALIVGLSRAQEDHKHIPPGKQHPPPTQQQQQRFAPPSENLRDSTGRRG